VERRGARKGRDNDNRHLQVLNARSESEFEQILRNRRATADRGDGGHFGHHGLE